MSRHRRQRVRRRRRATLSAWVDVEPPPYALRAQRNTLTGNYRYVAKAPLERVFLSITLGEEVSIGQQ